MSDEKEVGSLEAAALKRKERLAALRAAKEKKDKPATSAPDESNGSGQNTALPKYVYVYLFSDVLSYWKNA